MEYVLAIVIIAATWWLCNLIAFCWWLGKLDVLLAKTMFVEVDHAHKLVQELRPILKRVWRDGHSIEAAACTIIDACLVADQHWQNFAGQHLTDRELDEALDLHIAETLRDGGWKP